MSAYNLNGVFDMAEKLSGHVKNLIIYEGAMCCSTGVCGPEPNRELIEFRDTLRKLQKDFAPLNAVRASMSSSLNMFLENKEILELVKKKGTKILPITTLNGKIIGKQRYLTYEELSNILNGDLK